MSTARPTALCPDAETLAAVAEGFISRKESAALLAHIDDCEDCMAALAAVNETIATRNVVPFARRHTWWLAAAAVLVIGVMSFVVLRDRSVLPFRERSSMARLIELAPRSARPAEARLSGGFPWAAYRGPMRADDENADPQRMRLIGTAGDIVAAADRDRSANAQQTAGVALVLIDKPIAAIDRLRIAVQKSPGDAAAWSDLAAAQYSAALDLSRPSLLPEALDSVDHALRIDSRNAEARFNRALILERLGLTQEARAAWERYLEIDSTSPWAMEARERLAKIKATPAATQSDAQHARTFAEAETLGRWGEALQRGDAPEAERGLMVFVVALARDLALEADRQLAAARADARAAIGRKFLEAIWRYYNLVDFLVTQRNARAATTVRLAFDEAEGYVKAAPPAPERLGEPLRRIVHALTGVIETSSQSARRDSS